MLLSILQVAVYEKGQDLMVEGCPAQSFFMVEEGSLELTRRRFKVRSAQCVVQVLYSLFPFPAVPSVCMHPPECVSAFVCACMCACCVRAWHFCCVLCDVYMWCAVGAVLSFICPSRLSFLCVYA
jgi:hypothetical protein